MADHGLAIGRVETVEGEVLVERADGTQEVLEPGDAIYEGDVIETADDANVSMVMADQSQFSLGENGKMAMDEMVYDADSQDGSALVSVSEGVFVFVSGMIAKTSVDAMVIRTPTMTMGIRGTKLIGEAGPEGDVNAVTLLEEDGGHVGEITVFNDMGVQVLNRANQTIKVAGSDHALHEPITLTTEVVAETYGPVPLFRTGADDTPADAPADRRHDAAPANKEDDEDDAAETGEGEEARAGDEAVEALEAEAADVMVEGVFDPFLLEGELEEELELAESGIYPDEDRDDDLLARVEMTDEELTAWKASQVASLSSDDGDEHATTIDAAVGTDTITETDYANVPAFDDGRDDGAITAGVYDDAGNEDYQVAVLEAVHYADQTGYTDTLAGIAQTWNDNADLLQAHLSPADWIRDVVEHQGIDLGPLGGLAENHAEVLFDAAQLTLGGVPDGYGGDFDRFDPAAIETAGRALESGFAVKLEEIAHTWQAQSVDFAGDVAPEEWLMGLIDHGDIDLGQFMPETVERAEVLFDAAKITAHVEQAMQPEPDPVVGEGYTTSVADAGEPVAPADPNLA